MSEPRDQISEQISDALDGRLSESEERAFRARCAADPELARGWETQRQIRETLLQLGTEPAPAELAGRLALELRRGEGPAIAELAPRRGLRRALLRAAAAVVLLVGAVTTWSVLFHEDSPTNPPTRFAEGSDAAARLEGGKQPSPVTVPPASEAVSGGLVAAESEEAAAKDEELPDATGAPRKTVPSRRSSRPLTTVDPAYAVYQRRTRETLKAQVVARIRAAQRDDLRRSGESHDVDEVARAVIVEAQSIPEELQDGLVADANRSVFAGDRSGERAERDRASDRPTKENRTRDEDRSKRGLGGTREKARGAKKAAEPRSSGGEGGRVRAKGAPKAAPAPPPPPVARPRTATPGDPGRFASSATPPAGFFLVGNGKSREVVSRSIAALPAEAVRELHLDAAAPRDAKDLRDRAQGSEKAGAPLYRIYQLTLPHAEARRLVSDLETELGSKLRAVGQGTLPHTAPESSRDAETGEVLRVLRLVVTTSD